jgi:hypothetical protein
MAEERLTTPPPRDIPSSPPVLMRKSGQIQKISDKDRLKIDIFDLHRALSDYSGKITLESIFNFMNSNKLSSVDYLTKK